MRALISLHLWKLVGAVTMAELVIVAADVTTSDPYVDTLLKGGPFAIVVALMVADKIGTHGERDRLRIENTALRNEIKELNDDLRKDVMPPLTGIATGLPEFTRLLERVALVLDRVDTALTAATTALSKRPK